MPADDLNDVRAALGAAINSLRSLHEKVDDLHEKVDDLTARHTTFTRLNRIVEEMDGWLDELPTALERIGQDPTMGMFIGPFAGPLVESLRTVQDRMRAATQAPAIESLPVDPTKL